MVADRFHLQGQEGMFLGAVIRKLGNESGMTSLGRRGAVLEVNGVEVSKTGAVLMCYLLISAVISGSAHSSVSGNKVDSINEVFGARTEVKVTANEDNVMGFDFGQKLIQSGHASIVHVLRYVRGDEGGITVCSAQSDRNDVVIKNRFVTTVVPIPMLDPKDCNTIVTLFVMRGHDSADVRICLLQGSKHVFPHASFLPEEDSSTIGLLNDCGDPSSYRCSRW